MLSNATDSIGPFLGQEYAAVAFDNMIRVGPAPFGHQAFLAVRDSLWVYGSNDTYEYRVLNRRGRVRRIVRRSTPIEPLTDREIAAYKSARLRRSEGTRFRALERKAIDLSPFPRTFPAYKALRVDAAGYVWVQSYDAGEDSTNMWTIFDPSGRMLGSMRLPSVLRVEEIGREYLLGIAVDEDGVEQVLEYRLYRSQSTDGPRQ